MLTATGEIDLETAPLLDQAIREISEAGPERLLIDLAEIDFIDSTGLHVLLDAQGAADSNGHRLSLRHASRQVQRLLELTGVSSRFEFEED